MAGVEHEAYVGPVGPVGPVGDSGGGGGSGSSSGGGASRPEWLFGYGSLIWKPEPGLEDAETVVGKVEGWVRRFHQGSTDHRGTPEAPGRVVTLEPAADGAVWGRAYRLPDGPVKDSLFAALDHREKDGYETIVLDIVTEHGAVIKGMAYIATPANPSYAGPAPTHALAATIAASAGDSGPNSEYLLNLDKALVGLGLVDDHVHTLAQAVSNLLEPSE